MPESMEMPAKIRLMYYLWLKKGYGGTKTELARELNYADETTVSKHLNALEKMGYVEEKISGNDRKICLTRKGEHKIWFLTYPRRIVYVLVLFGFAFLFLGIGLFFGLKPEPISYSVSGAAFVILSVILAYAVSKMEKELFSLGN